MRKICSASILLASETLALHLSFHLGLLYFEKALLQKQYKKLDDESWFAEIEGFEGVWGNGLTVEDCCQDLLEVLEEWIILKLEDGDPLPVMDGI